MRKGKGFTLIELLVVIAVIALLLAILVPTLHRARYEHLRMTCTNNLSQIGKAMHFYSNDYYNELPRAGGPNATWGHTPNWQADTIADAYGLETDKTAAQASISASLYLLVKYEQITPKSFICKGDRGVTDFKPSEYGAYDKELYDLWDFGPQPSEHYSYSYHIPYGIYSLTTSNLPGMAVVADLNPWIKTDRKDARTNDDWSAFSPAADREHIKRGNTLSHQDEGQNVLFVDSQVAFEKTPACAVNNDNIYTSQNGSDIRKGTLTTQPSSRTDSLLVHDSPTGASK
jgi:prepilin-type N-terminal cleavage/methylation domain-containing protein